MIFAQQLLQQEFEDGRWG